MHEVIFIMDGLEINCAQSDTKGPALLLLHGSADRWQVFEPVLEKFTSFSQIFAIDLRGHGKSSHSASSYYLSDYVKDALALIQDHIQKPVVVFGHSFGGMIGMQLAAQSPQTVSALILGDVPLNIDTLKNHVMAQKELGLQVIDCLREKDIERLNELIPDAAAAESIAMCDARLLEAMFNDFDSCFSSYQPKELIPNIRCPTLLLRGSPGKTLTLDKDLNECLSLFLAPYRIETLDCGHGLIREAPDSVVSLTKAFIEMYSQTNARARTSVT